MTKKINFSKEKVKDDSILKVLNTMKTTKKKSDEELIEEEKEKLFSRLVETEGIDEYECQKLALIYRDLVPGDVRGPISARRMKEFFEEEMIKNNPNMEQKMLNYYDFKKEELPKKKFMKLTNIIESFMNGFRTIDNLYKISIAFREAVKRMAPKLQTSEQMSELDRVKWLRIWVVVIRDQMLFWGDMDEKRNFLGRDNTLKFNGYYINPETMIFLENLYFSAMPDGTVVLLDMLESLLNLYPEDIKQKIIRYGELEENIPDSTKVERIRNDIKRLLFPIPWVTESAYFCTNAGITRLEPERIKKAVEAYKNGGIENLQSFESTYFDVYNNCKVRKMKCYRYDETFKAPDFCVSVTCNKELEMYVETYKWLLKHPDFRFGQEQKTLSEYGMENLLESKVNFEEASTEWALENGYAIDIEDVNIELLSTVIQEGNEDLMIDYYEGEISSDTLFKKLGLKNDWQARMLCSKSAKFSVSAERDLKDSLKRVSQFGAAMCSKADNIYVEIFKYMLKNKPECLPKTLVNVYGKRFN